MYPEVLRFGPGLEGLPGGFYKILRAKLYSKTITQFLRSTQDIEEPKECPRWFSSDAKVEDCSKPLPESSRHSHYKARSWKCLGVCDTPRREHFSILSVDL